MMWVTMLLVLAGISIIGTVYMKYSVLMTILVCVIAGVLTVLNFLLFRKFPKIIKNVILIIGIVVCCVLLYIAKQKPLAYHFTDYTVDIMDTEDKMANNPKNSERYLERLVDKYGETDGILGMYSEMALYEDDIDKAYEYVEKMQDQNSMDYYKRMELVYLFDDEEDRTDSLYKLYENAAEAYPEWHYMWRMAGIANFEQENYTAAEYYLLGSLEIIKGDAIAYYYLGAASAEMGNNENAMGYFSRALEIGVDEEMQAWIAIYMEGMV